jgi:hypothetical protein
MYRVILLIFLCFSLQAVEKEKRKYRLSPFTVDLILHWQDMKNFPYSRHFIWEDEQEKVVDLFRDYNQTKKYSKTTKGKLKEKLQVFFQTFGFQLGENEANLFVIADDDDEGFAEESGFTRAYILKLTASEKVHRLMARVNSYFDEKNAEIYNSRPGRNIRITFLSVPVELARKKGLDFFPALGNSQSAVMKNKDFSQFLDQITKKKGCQIIAQASTPTVSGNSTFVRQVEEHFFPESYGFEGQLVEKTEIINKEISTYRKLVEVKGVEPYFGESRDIGFIAEVATQVQPDGERISVDLKSELTHLVGWTHDLKAPSIKMPVIRAVTNECHMTGKLGYTFCFGAVYNRSLNNSASHSVTKEEYKEFASEKCIVFYVSFEKPVLEKSAALGEGALDFILIPVGDRCNKMLTYLYGANKDISSDVKTLLVSMGVKFHQKSRLYYDSEHTALFLLNTHQENEKVSSLLKTVSKPSRNELWRSGEYGNVKYSLVSVEVPVSYVNKYKIKPGEQFISRISLKELFKEIEMDKDAKISNVSSGIASNGSTAIVRNVLEVYFPESFSHDIVEGKLTSSPDFGDSRDLGGIVEIAVQVDPDNNNIEADLIPMDVELKDWQNYEGKRMPIISSRTQDTRVMLKNGKVMLLYDMKKTSPFKKTPKPDKVILQFLNLEVEKGEIK